MINFPPQVGSHAAAEGNITDFGVLTEDGNCLRRKEVCVMHATCLFTALTMIIQVPGSRRGPDPARRGAGTIRAGQMARKMSHAHIPRLNPDLTGLPRSR
jgi:hypothetical protein